MTTNISTTEVTSTGPLARRRFRIAALAALIAVAGIGAAASPADAATGTTGLHYRSNATCKGISSPVVAMSDVVTVAAPTIYAANTTSGLDGQMVSFRQRLVRWSGSAWVATNQYSAIWTGFATDSTAALDFSNAGKTVRLPTFNFTAGAGYYAVVTDYWWPNGSDAAYAVHAPSSNNAYCAFAY